MDMTTFIKVKIKDVAEINPDALGRDFKCSSIEYVDISSVGVGKLADTQKLYIQDAPSRAKRLVSPGDTILSTVRPNRRSFFYFNNPKENTVVSTGFAVLRALKNNDSRYLYYSVTEQSFTDYLTKNAKGSAYPAVDAGIIYDGEIYIPEKTEDQARIASVLSAYDDLIENNEKRIKALEEMAQLLYTEWFVKFKFPGHEKVKMVDSGTEYGMVPAGWEVAPISKLADFINGYPFKPKDLGDQGFPIVKIPELRSGILEKTPRNSGAGLHKKYFVQTGDILFSWSATLLVNIWNSGEALLNQHLFKVTPKKQNYGSYTFYTLVLLVEKIKKHVVGATMQHLRKDTVESAKVLLPSTEVLTDYESKAAKILEQISVLYRHNNNLSKTRDLLIPQLVTGKRELK